MPALLLLLLLDVTRPAYLGLTEVEFGRFDVEWRVPRRGDRVLAIPANVKRLVRQGRTPSEAASSVSERLRSDGGVGPASTSAPRPQVRLRSGRRPPPFAGAR